MTPLEKAEQLVEAFQKACGSFGNGVYAATICCNEIIEVLQLYKCLSGEDIYSHKITYWQQVKDQITKL